MNALLRLTACYAATAALCATASFARAGDAAERFVSDYQPHADALRAFYTGREIRYRLAAPAGSGRQQDTVSKARYDHQNYVITDEGSTFTGGKAGEPPLKTKAMIAGRNRLYSFLLDVKGPNEYVIRQATVFAAGRFDPNNAGLCQLCFPYADPFVRLTYLEIATDPEFTVVDYTDAKWRDGRPVKELKVKKAYPRLGTGEKVWVMERYSFDPANGWVCVGNRSQGEGETTAIQKVYEYEPAGESLPAIKHWEVWFTDGKGTERRTLSYDVLEFRRAADFSEAECRLSAFGLPEPVGIEWEKPTPRYVWFLLAAGGFAALMIGFRYLAHRRRATKTMVPA